MGTVLVVDDNADTNEILSKILRNHGQRTVNAYTGEGAIALLATEKVDLVILDIMMPGMDGMEVLRLIRSTPTSAKVPVILFSAISDPDFQKHALQKGANDYWTKGNVDFTRLKELVSKYV